MTKIIITITCAFLYINAQTQTVIWDSTSNWRLYTIQNSKAMRIAEDSLKAAHSIELVKNDILPFLKASHQLKVKEGLLWNGIFLLSYELPVGKLNKLYVSSNGSFIFDKSSGTYIQIPELDRENWKEYINNNLKKVRSDN